MGNCFSSHSDDDVQPTGRGSNFQGQGKVLGAASSPSVGQPQRRIGSAATPSPLQPNERVGSQIVSPGQPEPRVGSATPSGPLQPQANISSSATPSSNMGQGSSNPMEAQESPAGQQMPPATRTGDKENPSTRQSVTSSQQKTGREDSQALRDARLRVAKCEVNEHKMKPPEQ
ncbi:MAG: hypothetical protein Q9162_004758 [Coniocarpon cinnabarinum]